MVELEFKPRHFGFRNSDLHHHNRLLLNGIQNKFQARKICIKSSDFITEVFLSCFHQMSILASLTNSHFHSFTFEMLFFF